MLHFSKGQKYVQNTSSRPFIILIAVLCTLTGFARAFDNADIEKFYHYCPVKVDKLVFEIIEI